MSSRILAPWEQHEITLPVWRQIPTGDEAVVNTAPTADPAVEIARLQKQWEQRVAEARAAGFREGESSGRSAASAELQPVLQRLGRSVEEILALRPKLRREAESDMVHLSLAIARRILRREISTDPEAMHGLVLAALEKLQMQEISRIRVHPSHVAQVKACLQQVSAELEVVGDGSRQPGAVAIETMHGDLEASVDSQLQEIERGLIDRLDRQP